MQNARTARKAKEIQGYADYNEWKDYFSAIYCPPAKEKTQILQRWAQQFRGVLKNPSTISDTAIVRPPQLKTNTNLDLPLPLHETISTVQLLSNEKAPASDASCAEVYKHDGPEFMEHLTALFQDMRRQGEVSHDFKDTTIIHLYKRIKNRQLSDNYRGICLLNIADKPGKLGIPRPGQTNVEENIEDRLNNRRSQSHHRRRRLTTPSSNHLQHVHNDSEHSGRQLDFLDTSVPTAAHGLHQPSSLLPSLLCTSHKIN
nr:unnamed protein product [Spirometra erinaceieuropaei]